MQSKLQDQDVEPSLYLRSTGPIVLTETRSFVSSPFGFVIVLTDSICTVLVTPESLGNFPWLSKPWLPKLLFPGRLSKLDEARRERFSGVLEEDKLPRLLVKFALPGSCFRIPPWGLFETICCWFTNCGSMRVSCWGSATGISRKLLSLVVIVGNTTGRVCVVVGCKISWPMRFIQGSIFFGGWTICSCCVSFTAWVSEGRESVWLLKRMTYNTLWMNAWRNKS